MSNNNTVDRINTVTLQLRSDIHHSSCGISSCGILIAYEVSKLPPISPNKKIKLSESPFHYNHPSSTAPMMVWIQSYDFHMEKARRRLKSLGYDSDNISFVPFSSKEAFEDLYPFINPVEEWDGLGYIGEYQRLYNRTPSKMKFKNISLPRISPDWDFKNDGDPSRFDEYLTPTQKTYSVMSPNEFKRYVYGNGTTGERRYPEGYWWDATLNCISQFSTGKFRSNTLLDMAWEVLAHKYGYEHERASAPEEVYMKWNEENDKSSGKGNQRCTDLEECKDWENYHMEKWIVDYLKSTKRPLFKLCPTTMEHFYDHSQKVVSPVFSLNDYTDNVNAYWNPIIKNINEVRVSKNWEHLEILTNKNPQAECL
jgi:hypothetical protein